MPLSANADAPGTGPTYRHERSDDVAGQGHRTLFEREYGGLMFRSDLGTTVEYTVTGDELVTFRVLRATGRRQGRVGPRADHVLFWFDSGRTVLTTPERRHDLAVNAPTLLTASGQFTFDSTSERVQLVHVAASLVRETAQRLGLARPHETVVFATEPDLDLDLGALRAVLQETGPLLADPSTDPQRRIALDRRLAEAVLDAFPFRAVDAARVDAGDLLRDVTAWVDAHAHEPLTSDHVAAAVGISVRALQERFRRGMRTSPTRYLREVRLDRVREDLAAATPRETSVREVAVRWQFAHLGRFAGAYRERFGEHPGATLRRGGPR